MKTGINKVLARKGRIIYGMVKSTYPPYKLELVIIRNFAGK